LRIGSGQRRGGAPFLTQLLTAASLATALVFSPSSAGLSLPEDLLQFEFNHYTGSFGVDVLYPAVSVQKQITENLSVSGRYLVDAITSASMRSRFDVDGVTSATTQSSGGDEHTFEEVRHEVGGGIARRLGSGIGNLHGIYSTENDYSSRSVVASISYPLWDQNTELHAGLVRSWDEVSPVHRDWTRKKDLTKVRAGWTQVLTTRMIAQVNYTRTHMTGYLSDPYHVVSILDLDRQEVVNYEAVHPDRRDRSAIGMSMKVKSSDDSAVEFGYRRYWDSWSVDSDTIHALYQQRLFQGGLTLGLEVRGYSQGRAGFFRPEYDAPEQHMTVDIRLETGRSMEYTLRWSLPGTVVHGLGIVDGTALDLDGSFGFYRRKTTTADWHSRSRELNALVSRVGFRYRY